MKIEVSVKPDSKEDSVSKDAFGLTVKTKAHAVDNKANEAVIELLADYFDVAKSTIRVVRGHHARKKVIEL
ncbi:MAG: DUF167 domain-containing protein [bacterium]|nr:DUF167 domain-containing protein [bacterium]